MLADHAVPALGAPAARGVASRGGFVEARWSAGELGALACHLAARGAAALAGLARERRLAAWTDTVECLLDPASAERRQLFAPLVATSRLSREGLSEALEVVVGGAGAEAARRLAERAAPAASAAPCGVVLAANVPGLAVQTLLPALVVGRPLLLRSSRREPLFAPALVTALTRREPALADAFAAVTWPAADEESAEAAFSLCERVVAYGGEAALGELRRRLGSRLVGLGPRASVALVSADADPLSAARALGRDVALLDQRGCLSVQAVYTAGEARELAAALGFALAREQRALPPGPAEAEVVAAVQQLRGEAALRGALVEELPLAAGSVVLAADAEFQPVPGLRAVRVHGVRALDEALAALGAWRGRLQGAALAGAEALARGDEIARRLALARVAPAGRLQHAEAGWASGGLDPLAALAGAPGDQASPE